MEIILSIIIVAASLAVLVTGLRFYFRFYRHDKSHLGGLFLVVASVGFSLSELARATAVFGHGIGSSISEMVGILADILLAIGFVRLFNRELVDEKVHQGELESSLTASVELLQATRQLNDSLDLQQILTNFVQRAQVLARADVALIILNEETHILNDRYFSAGLVESVNVTDQVLKEISQKISESGNPMIWSGQEEEFRSCNSPLSLILKTIAGFPIQEGKDPLGVLFVGYEQPRHIDPRDLLLMTDLADHGALAIRNAALFQKVEELSLTDPLTGLANRRQFDSTLTVELARARRHHGPLSLLILDLDHFKTINDTWGHPAGDAVLKMVAGILQKGIRVGDLAARVGGEEIALLLPHTDLSDAFQLGERLRGTIERTACQWQGQTIHMTCSIGVVGQPGDSLPDDPQAFFQLADQALYNAKQAGRNQIRCNKVTGGHVHYFMLQS